MRCAQSAWLGVLFLTLTGCLHDRPARSSSFVDRFRPGPTGPDAAFVDYAVIERPAGNVEINRKIWDNIDEMVIDPAARALLGENGLRVGVVGSMLSPELEAMIANPVSDTGRRRQSLYVNNPVAVPVNGPINTADYHVRNSMETQSITAHFDQARFVISMTPSHAPDGKILLRCVPEVEYQDKKYWLPTGGVAAGWIGNKPVERYSSLGWDLKLSPNEYLVIGSFYERGPWLGNQIFAGSQGNSKVQRLLIVRAGHLFPTEPGESLGKDNVVPLAAQAAISAVRSERP